MSRARARLSARRVVSRPRVRENNRSHGCQRLSHQNGRRGGAGSCHADSCTGHPAWHRSRRIFGRHPPAPNPSVAPHTHQRGQLPQDDRCGAGDEHALGRPFPRGYMSRSPWAFTSSGVGRRIGGRRSAGGRFSAGYWSAGGFSTWLGVVDHHILTIHHVREGAKVNETAWDLAFLALGAVLAVGGWLSPAPTNAFQTDSDATIAAREQPARARFVRSRPRVMRMSVQS